MEAVGAARLRFQAKINCESFMLGNEKAAKADPHAPVYTAEKHLIQYVLVFNTKKSFNGFSSN